MKTEKKETKYVHIGAPNKFCLIVKLQIHQIKQNNGYIYIYILTYLVTLPCDVVCRLVK
jgi:hypothetical protein